MLNRSTFVVFSDVYREWGALKVTAMVELFEIFEYPPPQDSNSRLSPILFEP